MLLPSARILSSSTCVGLRYGYHMNNSGFSWQSGFTLFPTLSSVRFTSSDCAPDLPDVLLPRLRRAFRSRLALSACVPTVLSYDSTGISTCCPSATSLDLALGPDLPRADQLYPGNLLDISAEGFPPSSRYSFRHSLFHTIHSSFRYCFVSYTMLLYQSTFVNS